MISWLCSLNNIQPTRTQTRNDLFIIIKKKHTSALNRFTIYLCIVQFGLVLNKNTDSTYLGKKNMTYPSNNKNVDIKFSAHDPFLK